MEAVWTGLIGLLGVGLGGLIAAYSQNKERRHRWLREQLDEFYAPLYGMRKVIQTRSETRVKVSGAAGRAWAAPFEDVEGDIDSIRELRKRLPEYEKVIEDNNERFRTEVLPVYKKMADHFWQNIGLAEPSTRTHLSALLEFVEIWERWLDGKIPAEALPHLEHGEEKLLPLYDDIETNVTRLSAELSM
jgi:hypothetical protein